MIVTFTSALELMMMTTTMVIMITLSAQLKQFNTSVGERLMTMIQFPSPPRGATCRSLELTQVCIFSALKLDTITYNQNGLLVQNWVTLAKISQSWKNMSHLQKWVTIGKNGSTLQKWVKLKTFPRETCPT